MTDRISSERADWSPQRTMVVAGISRVDTSTLAAFVLPDEERVPLRAFYTGDLGARLLCSGTLRPQIRLPRRLVPPLIAVNVFSIFCHGEESKSSKIYLSAPYRSAVTTVTPIFVNSSLTSSNADSPLANWKLSCEILPRDCRFLGSFKLELEAEDNKSKDKQQKRNGWRGSASNAAQDDSARMPRQEWPSARRDTSFRCVEGSPLADKIGL